MASTLTISAQWIRERPNIAKVPLLYTVDKAVGLGCPNSELDVMLVQYMLRKWIETSLWVGNFPRGYQFRNLAVSGLFDNRVLAWIFFFQLTCCSAWGHDAGSLTGKIEPIRDIGSTTGSTMIELNVQLGGFTPGKPFNSLWLNMADASDMPMQLSSALKKARAPG